MRMIGLALVVFIFAGAAVALSMIGVRDLGARAEALLRPTGLVFEETVAQDAPEGEEATILRAWPRQAMVMSGLPAYQGARFALPRDARPLGGILHVDATAQVSDGADAMLRISIDNMRRAEVLLAPGDTRRSFQIPLTAMELSGGLLPVSFSLQGRGAEGPCSAPGIGAVVEIEPTTRIELIVDEPLDSVTDRAISWGSVARVGWPRWLVASEQPKRLALAADLLRDGQPVQFWDGPDAEALSTDELRALATTLAANGSALPGVATDTRTRLGVPVGFPMALTDQAANDGLRRFTRSTTWRARIEAEDMPASEVPGRLDLGLYLGPLPAQAHWTVTVQMNGRLVQADRVTGGEHDYQRRITLPTIAPREAASLEITASSDYEIEGICNDGPELLAEMRPTTLLQGAGAAQDDLEVLRMTLAQTESQLDVALGSALTAPEAMRAARMLTALAPQGLALVAGADDNQPQAHPQALAHAGLPPAEMLTAALDRDDESHWLLWSEPVSGVTYARALRDAGDLTDLPARPVTLFVTLPVRSLAAGDLRSTQ
ncbi:hypothetical protein [Pseudooceanicola algae]|uniref:Cyclic di-GMP-binding protein n=1 Tax=Pseudooceanicola algae TaxID=1537215 RepID=A0A418SGW5_9RHOB|nr:hypothetical protein [Pseudooceanicola algae]QPM90304.1 hypothetical protein PSAL_015390 [Pseudooceanicola algae]QPM90545.1 hypothetical protein PSAL_017840 [Pseudooceanicola algae]